MPSSPHAPARRSGPCCSKTTHLVAKQVTAFASLFRALCDETRLEILGLLSAKGEAMCACEIEQHFALSQPTVSHHLRLLREAGLVSGERRGTWIHYTIDRRALQHVRKFVEVLGE